MTTVTDEHNNFLRRMARRRRTRRAVGLVAALAFLLAASVTPAFIAMHFIVKYW